MRLSDQDRFLIRFARTSFGVDPVSELKQKMRPVSWELGNMRVSSIAVETDLWCPRPASEGQVSVWANEQAVVLTFRSLRESATPGSIDPSHAWSEARTLFKEERFWEAHETLEGLWKQSALPQKSWAQGVILIAAGLVHLQKNERAVVPDLWRKGMERLSGAPDELESFPVGRLKNQVQSQLSDDKQLTAFQL